MLCFAGLAGAVRYGAVNVDGSPDSFEAYLEAPEMSEQPFLELLRSLAHLFFEADRVQSIIGSPFALLVPLAFVGLLLC